MDPVANSGSGAARSGWRRGFLFALFLMAWITFAAAAVPVTADEVTKVNAIVGSSTLDAITVKAVNRVRSFVPGVRGPDGTIPDEMADQCGDIAAYNFLSQFGSGRLITKPRQDKYDRAEKDLEMLAAGKITVVPPDVAAPVQASSPSPSFQGRKRHNQRRRHDGF